MIFNGSALDTLKKSFNRNTAYTIENDNSETVGFVWQNQQNKLQKQQQQQQQNGIINSTFVGVDLITISLSLTLSFHPQWVLCTRWIIVLGHIQRQQTIDATMFMQWKITIQSEKGADRFVTRQLRKYSQLIANARHIVAATAIAVVVVIVRRRRRSHYYPLYPNIWRIQIYTNHLVNK